MISTEPLISGCRHHKRQYWVRNSCVRFSISALILTVIISFEQSAAIGSLYGGDGNPGSGRLNTGRLLKYSAVVAGGMLTFALDRELRSIYRKPRFHGQTADALFENAENFGTGTPYFFMAPAFLGYGIIAKSERGFKTGEELAIGLLASYGVTAGVKALFGRKRPYQSDSPYDFFEGGRSFYSGHTITAFTAATIISSNYPRQNLGFLGIERDLPILPVLAYSTAGLVGMQRLYSDVHWSSDVYVGALAGYGIGKLTEYFVNRIDTGYLIFFPGETPVLAIGFAF